MESVLKGKLLELKELGEIVWGMVLGVVICDDFG